MLTCPSCGQDNPEIARFCHACGAALSCEPPGRGEERRDVTVLFVDLVGFTSRAETLDPEDVRAILDRYHVRVRDEIERFGGIVEKFVGDAVMAVFGAPVAYGDDPERAVRAALAVRQALADLNASDPDLDLQARIAVNTGEAVVALAARPGHGEAMVAGDVVNTAARLQVSAPVNGIVVGEETYRSTRGAIEYEPGEPVTARGKERPVPVWFARAATTPAGERMLSPVPMVGRQREVDLLRGTWERVVGERRAHLVTIFGPPGIGKSRLAWEFGELVTDLGGWTLRGRSTPYGASSPYAAFAAHLKQVARIFDSDPAPVAAEKLHASVADLIGATEAAEVASHLASLAAIRIGTEAPDRQTLFLAARRLIEQVAARRPTLLVFEDLHWADGSMLDLLDELAARLHGAPVFLLAVARPDLLTERPAWGGGLPAYTALPLEPLRGEDAQELAERLLGNRDLEGISRLLEISEGNPLFIEELAASLAERSGEAAQELPTSIRAIIASRLDALPAPERSLLLDAAVVGRVFWDGALSPMGEDRDVWRLLGSLERRDLIRRESVSRLQGQEQFPLQARPDPGDRLPEADAGLPADAARGGRALPRGGDRRDRSRCGGDRSPLARGGRRWAGRRVPRGRRRGRRTRLGEGAGGGSLPGSAGARSRRRSQTARPAASARRRRPGAVPRARCRALAPGLISRGGSRPA
ncbi:MAG: AAA family ATPase [Actinobacteria bacterium]|nr:AAA family ATPase [Actinomycetota bacterium]